jgi:hypothetical protein
MAQNLNKHMNQFDKVITMLDDKDRLFAIQYHDMKKKSVITYTVTEVGMEESLALLNKIANKTTIITNQNTIKDINATSPEDEIISENESPY